MNPAPDRRRELARIHCLKAELGLGDDEYRDVLFALERVRSASDLDWAGRRRVIEHLEARRRALSPVPSPAGGRGAKDGGDEWAFVARRPSHGVEVWEITLERAK